MINKIKGTKDFSTIEYMIKDFVTNAFESVIARHEYKMIETPILEQSSLFKRSVGDSEIAKKEMYEFVDKGEREIALRPEGTASFVRALIENKWYTQDNLRFAYCGPMFRYEQPQKGRYRQFYQAGIEFVGEKNYLHDVDVILTAADLLDVFNVEYELQINSIGDETSRKNYEHALKEYLLPFKDQLSSISQERLESGRVLRILDDKVDSKHDFIKNAPKIHDYLSDSSREYFESILKMLDKFEVSYKVSDELVRGLDYYDEVVFEFVSTDKNVGSQSTLIGGGRYSNLISELDGPKISSVGFGFGVDRFIDLIRENFVEQTNVEEELRQVDVYIAMSNDQENVDYAFYLTNQHLRTFFSADCEFDLIKSKKVFDKAQKRGAKVLIYDDKFLDKNLLCAKSLKTKDKIIFSKNTQGIADLFEFILDNCADDLDVEIEEIEEYIDELAGANE
ncbi:histidine--tRNA ligase [Mycoplasma sp. Pen4]|uniref:histidine--tRNA ligase n=1 Tax=Mycoplasma sp. Pen4 TaxID=640330 RepID=UPI0016548885|nr:histidine--tRNA ligase [Mycoplasma sp. Pen4]QNM93496.1 histidine--tRNA ligase [Mycoplasma sp. Pen4]